MKNFIFRISFFLFLLIGLSAKTQYAFSQQKDSVSNTINTDENVEDGEFNLFLMMFVLAAICLMIGSFIAGVIIIVLVLVLFIGLISLGILSASVLVGAYKRSFSAGFKVFIMMSSCFLCAAIGLLGFAIVAKSFALEISRQTIVFTGLTVGAIGGLCLGWIAYRLIRVVLKWATQKITSL